MEGKLEIYRNGELIAESDGTINAEIGDGNTLSTGYTGETFSFDVVVDGLEDNSSFLVSSDSEWAKIKRVRNKVDIIVEPNHDTEYRTCVLRFTHNVAYEVVCLVSIVQDEEVYSISITEEEITFPLIGNDDVDLSVNCIGGTGKFKIFKPKRYRHIVMEDGYEYEKRVAYDWGVKVKRLETNDGINISTEGTLDSIYANGEYINNSYYIITVSHEDVIGVTDTVKVRFSDDSSADLPDKLTPKTSSEDECPEETLLPPKITDWHEPDVNPSITLVDERDGDIEINSTDYTYIDVVTEPVESLVYFRYYGDFIKDVQITHDGDKSTVGIKAKPNPYPLSRKSIGYVINAEYPSYTQEIRFLQRGGT